ncbi:metallophosphoesterase [Rhodococcus sp. SGAir0479]|uniref:metallophosphoesterase n=1 Tax=Rhodococcus sp. SGAir0479 TaxID=2567884 RepID=UPI0010CCFDB9|nr:metallophosphoesterase [Rhodococcus sp. SGAir0479]QCQ91227.1 metallophosphoesterase [Rhodococcus sp. SGAir0479]
MVRIAVFAVFLALVSWWVHRRLVRVVGLTGRPARVIDTALVAFWVLALIGIGSGEVFDPVWARIPAFVGWTWLAALLYLVLGLVVLAAGSGIARLAGRPQPTDPSRRRVLRGVTAAVAVAAVGTAGYGVVEAHTPRIQRVRVPLRRLPSEFAGTRIALVTDLHVGPSRGAGFTRKVVDLVNAQKPELVLLGGDLVDGTVAKVGADLEPLRDLRAPLGVFGVSGNHEFYAGDGGRWLDLWDTLGVRALRNERVEIRRGGGVIDLAGIHDLTSPAPYEPDLPAALAGRDPERFVLLLAHEPKQALEASELGVDLQLSGHTHGGQLWPLGYLVPLQQPSVSGLDRIGDTVLYTTRGAGAWGPPARVGAPPEITILELASRPRG